MQASMAFVAVLALGVASCAAPGSVHESSTQQFELTACPPTFPHAPPIPPAPPDPVFGTPPIASISRDKELIITDLSVVQNSCQSGWTAPAGLTCTPSTLGKWTFGWLMTAMAGQTSITSTKARQFVASWLVTWLTKKHVSPDPTDVAARPRIWDKVLKPWLQASNCTLPPDSSPPNPVADGAARSSAVMTCASSVDPTKVLDLQKAPFRLSAIVNRIDLDGRDYAGNGAPGELRFVFGAFDATTAGLTKLNAAVIFEYHFPTIVAGSLYRSFQWANDLHLLASRSFGVDFNGQLNMITSRVVEPNAWSARPNGSAISHVRTDEIDFDVISANRQWEFRQFALSTCLDPNLTGFACLQQEPVSQTPPNGSNYSPWLTTFLSNNQGNPGNQGNAAIGSHVVPPSQLGGSSLSAGGAAAFVWNTAVDVNDPDFPGLVHVLVAPSDLPHSLAVRHGFALNTCNGCHYLETNIGPQVFFHVGSRNATELAGLSGFVNLPMDTSHYDEVSDPNTDIVFRNNGDAYYFKYNEVWRRACELRRLLSGSSIPWSTSTGHGAGSPPP